MIKKSKTSRTFCKKSIYNQCKRKKGFTTTKEANKAVHSAWNKDHMRLSYYKCDVCGKFHLTKKYVRSKF